MPINLINDVALRYRELGDRDNQTIVFASSLLWSADTFSELLTELAKEYHLVIPDLHGHGASEYREAMTLESMTEDFYLLLPKANVDQTCFHTYNKRPRAPSSLLKDYHNCHCLQLLQQV